MITMLTIVMLVASILCMLFSPTLNDSPIWHGLGLAPLLFSMPEVRVVALHGTLQQVIMLPCTWQVHEYIHDAL